MNNIPPLDLTRQYKTIREDVSVAIAQVLDSGRYINGPVVEAFEQQFGQYIGTPHCVACNSGTDALFLALRALNIGPGDEVITSPFTFIATAETISAVGATPVFVDIDLHTFNLDVQQIEAAITPKTRAILPVHLFGQPIDMTQLMAIAQAHNLLVIEDCAQATGAEWQGQKVGSMGHVGCFSFFPTKNLGACGDGGAITTHDPTLAQQLQILREHGQPQRYVHTEIGINSRLDAVQAAILEIKLRHLETWNRQRQAIAERYNSLLQHLPEIATPRSQPEGRSAWNQYTIRLLDSTTDSSETQPNLRDRIRQQLQAHGVSSMVYYPIPLHRQPVYAHLSYSLGQLPNAEQAARQVLSLPMFPELSLEEQDQVVDSLKESLAQPLV